MAARPVIDLLGSAAAARIEPMRSAIRKAFETLPTHASYLKEVAAPA